MTVSVHASGRIDTPNGPFLELRVEGVVPPGSAGNYEAEEVARSVREALETERPTAVLLDCLKLEYRFGDGMLSFWPALHDPARMIWRPACVLARGKTGDALRSLIEWSQLNLFALRDTRDDALTFLHAEAAARTEERANSEDPRRTCLEALLPEFDCLSELPAWKAVKRGDGAADSSWVTTFVHDKMSFELSLAEHALEAHVGGHRYITELGSPPAEIDGFVHLIRQLLAGREPQEFFG